MTPPSLYILLTLNNVENLMSNNSDIHHLFLDRPWAEWGMTPPSLYILLTLNNVENLMSNN
ncbi:hypothetical protein CQA70_29795, partial [Klebsiella pneumoniae]